MGEPTDTGHEPAIDVSPQEALADDPLAIRVTGLEPGLPVTISARLRTGPAEAFESSATFVADSEGRVDLTSQAPVSGSYEGVDAMGLVWSAAPIGGRRRTGRQGREQPGQSEAPCAELRRAQELLLRADIDGRPVAGTGTQRKWLAPGIGCKHEIHHAMRGIYLRSNEPEPHPALLLLGGSEGGYGLVRRAAILASRGYTTLSLAYFGTPGLPQQLMDIPLDYFAVALEWLAAQPEVDAQRIGIMGASKGGELALLLASLHPELRAVVAYVPSGVVWQGIPGSFRGGAGAIGSSWSEGGEPVPFLRCRVGAGFILGSMWNALLRRPGSIRPIYEAALDDTGGIERALIPVERIRGPIMLISAGADQVWPSRELSELAIRRLSQHEFPYQVEHLHYPDAGHGIGLPFQPQLSSGFALGGTLEANARASADSWPKVLAFLDRALGAR